MTHLFLFDRLFPTYNKKIQELLWQTRKSLFLENKNGLYKYPLNRSFRLLPIRIVKSNVSSVGPSLLFLSDEGPILETLDFPYRQYYTILSVSAVLLNYPYRQYTNLFIFRFVSLGIDPLFSLLTCRESERISFIFEILYSRSENFPFCEPEFFL